MEGPKNIAAGAIGSRMAGRLTADLVLRSPQYMNCVGEYQIDLRGRAEDLSIMLSMENLQPGQSSMPLACVASQSCLMSFAFYYELWIDGAKDVLSRLRNHPLL